MRSKIFKILLCCMILFSSSLALKPKQEVYAIAPALIWLGGAIAGEVASEVGWKYVGEPAWEAVKEKIGGEISNNADEFDFTKKKAKKNKNGDIEIDVSPNDRAKVGKMLKDEATEIIEADKNRKAKASKPVYDIDYVSSDPFYKTSVEIEYYFGSDESSYHRGMDILQTLYDVEFMPKAYGNSTEVTWTSIVDGTSHSYTFSGGTYGSPAVHNVTAQYKYDNQAYMYNESMGTVYLSYLTVKYHNAYLKTLEQSNRVIYLANGLSVPEDNTKIYDVDMKTPSTYQLPKSSGLDKKFVIDMPDTYASEEEIEYTYEELYNDVTIKNDIDNSVEIYEDNRMNLTTNNYNYDYSTINYNYFYDSEEENEKVKNEITIIIENENNNGGGCSTCGGAGDLTPVDDPLEVPESFFKSMHEMGLQIKDMYKGVTDFLSMSVEGFKSLLDGTEGFIAFLDEFFEWLPNEFRVLLGSSFMLGVVAFFLRR